MRIPATRVFLGREVFGAALLLLGVYFLPPLLTGGQLLFESPAAPIWALSVRTSSDLGCPTLACVPVALGIFATYTYLLAVVAGTVFREVARYRGRE